MKHQLSTGFSLLACVGLFSCTHEAKREPAMQPAAGTAEPRRGTWASAPSYETGQSEADTWGHTISPMEEPAPRAEGLAVGKAADARVTQAQGITDIAITRCDRETKCGRIGDHRKFATHADCNSELTLEANKELGGDECSRGIVRDSFDKCLQQLRDADCKSQLDRLGAMGSCRSSNLCRD